MSTNYGSSGTIEVVGADFELASNSSRTFFTEPALSASESLFLQIKDVTGGTYRGVGTLADSANQVGTVTARGAGSSTFRVIKRKTQASTQMIFD